MRSKSIVWTSLLLVIVTVSFAAAETVPFVLSGELRVRNENDNRDFNSDTGYKSFNLLRTRLGIGVQPAQDLEVFVQIQDSRVAGRDNGPSTVPGVQEESTLDLHQGYFLVNNLGWQGFGLKAGRMEVRYGNERLLGVTDWNNVPTAFDGGVLAVDGNRFSVQAMYASLVERDTPAIGTVDNLNSDATLQAGFGTLVVNPSTNCDLQVINVRDKGDPALPDTRQLLTFGGRVHGKAAARFEYSVEGAYQSGSEETSATTSTDVAAYMFAGEVGMSFGNEAKPLRVAAGYDYLSGDGDGVADGKLETFNTLYGDEHTHYGLMDVTPVLNMASTEPHRRDRRLAGPAIARQGHRVAEPEQRAQPGRRVPQLQPGAGRQLARAAWATRWTCTRPGPTGSASCRPSASAPSCPATPWVRMPIPPTGRTSRGR